MKNLPVYDVVLLPPPAVNQRAIAVSEQMQSRGTEFILKSGEVYPHISLYMLNVLPENLEQTTVRLANIAASTAPLPLKAVRYGHNLQEGMFEVFYEKTPEISTLQETVITALNPLRHGLRSKNPVGHNIAETLPRTTGEAKHNLEEFGYDEIGSLFKPHITFTRFVQRDMEVPVATLPPLSEFDATYINFGLFEMGEHGTCIRQVALFTFK